MAGVRVAIGFILWAALACAAAADKTARLQFAEHLKRPHDLQFSAARERKAVSFRLPARLGPRAGSSLHLFVQHSPALDPDRSFLSVSLNHGIVRSIRLGRQSAQPVEIVLPIPPQMFRDENELSFFVEQSPRDGAQRSEAWTKISARSFIAMRFTEGAPQLDLAQLPAPLLEPHPLRETVLSVLLPHKITTDSLHATALVIANLSRRIAPERVQLRVVRSAQAARQPLLIVGTPTEQPPLRVLLRSNDAALRERDGLVGLATNGPANANPILYVTGDSSGAVLRAARSIHGEDWHASGKTARVAKDPAPGPQNTRDWPGFMPPRNLFTLADLGFKELKVMPQGDDPLEVPLNAIPDARFLASGNRMVLKLRLNPQVPLDDVRMVVQLNDATLAEVTKDSFRGAVASVPLRIPRGAMQARNVLRITWKGAPYALDQGAAAWVLPVSEFYLPRYYETELPELALLQFQLYPFSLKADLSDVLVVVPDRIEEESFAALLELSHAFGRLAPAPHLAFRVTRMGDLTETERADFHLVFLNPETRPDRLAGILSGWNSRAFKGRPVMREMRSPWNAQRYILVFNAKPGQLHRAVSEAFSPSTLAQLRGDAAYLTGKRPETLMIGPRHKMSEYSYFLLIEAWLRAHWLALPIILIAVSGLLFAGVRIVLRHYRAKVAAHPAT